MQFPTNLALLLTAMVASTGAIPVETNTDAIAPAADNTAANYNLQPMCQDGKTFRACTMLNTDPQCIGTKFQNNLGDQCSSSCWCE